MVYPRPGLHPRIGLHPSVACAGASSATKQISLGTDDCREEDDTTATLTLMYTYVGKSAGSVVYDTGLRWQSVDIAQGSSILSARLSMYLLTSASTILANVRGIDADNVSTWAAGNRPSQNAKTTATVTANNADWNNWGSGEWINLDITEIVQEIIDRSGWTANNALAVVIEDAGSAIANYVSIATYERSGNLHGAKLDIEYLEHSKTIPTCRLLIRDFNGTTHTVVDDIMGLETSTSMGDSTDTFSFSLDNTNDEYGYVEKGCAIEILTGVGTKTTKIVGYITETTRTRRGGVQPVITVSGEDGSIRLNDIFFSGRFYDYEISALFKAVLDAADLTTGETYRALADIDASNTYIDPTIYSIDEATYNWQSLGSVLKGLADLVGYGWYRDTDRVLHFFSPDAAAVSATIVDADLEGTPSISNVGEIVNRVVVIGGYEQTTDKTGSTQTDTILITDTSSNTQSFVPTEDYLSSVLVYTKLVPDSLSDITISIQGDSGAAPDGVHLSNGQMVVKVVDIVDLDYTEFRFDRPVTLTPTDTYWIVLEGTTSDGVRVGDAAGTLDYKTRYPGRVAIMANDEASQERYANADGSPGIYMQVFRDESMEDSQIAEVKAGELLMPTAKKTARLMVRGDSINAGDVVQLTISEIGISIDKKMKIMGSTQKLGENFIYNALDMEEV